MVYIHHTHGDILSYCDDDTSTAHRHGSVTTCAVHVCSKSFQCLY